MKPFDKKEKSDCSTSDDSPPQRPKRNTCQKTAGITNGLLWREETDLKKALYASLQENKKKNWEEDGEEHFEEDEQNQSSEGVVENGEEESPKKAKIHAQRKFAQGSTPNSPVLTPQKVTSVNNSSTQLLPYRRPKTEDFLTFLCLRGTSILPPSLDFLNSCSRSDTSSECRSLSPELEEYSKEPICKSTDAREKNSIKHENVVNGLSRKIGACKASSKRYLDAAVSVKKKLVNAKLRKEVIITKKRKIRDENVDPSRLKASSKLKSTGFNALREKYKKQRLAADKKKLIPAKNSNSSTSKKVTIAQKSQNNGKLSVLVPKNVSQKKPLKLGSSVIHKTKLSKLQKKLANEKRKSLRSADIRPKRLAALKKKTPWIRRAKLVPPIVDVESDSSEPEIIHTTPVKKVLSSNSSQKSIIKPNNISNRLRSKQDIPKVKSRLTPRQMLLRKHMKNRLKSKKSVLHTKNIRSRTIVKRTAKQTILKKVRKNLVIKTMSLRKDLQNKRVTRSAKHQIEEMLWSNPEKRSRTQNQKFVASKQDKKKSSGENQSAISKKKKLTVVPKRKEAVKEFKSSKNALKRKSHSTVSNSNKSIKESESPKVSDTSLNPAKISRRSLSRDEKPSCSGVKPFNHHQKYNLETSSSTASEVKTKSSVQSVLKKDLKTSSNRIDENSKASVSSNQQTSKTSKTTYEVKTKPSAQNDTKKDLKVNNNRVEEHNKALVISNQQTFFKTSKATNEVKTKSFAQGDIKKDLKVNNNRVEEHKALVISSQQTSKTSKTTNEVKTKSSAQNDTKKDLKVNNNHVEEHNKALVISSQQTSSKTSKTTNEVKTKSSAQNDIKKDLKVTNNRMEEQSKVSTILTSKSSKTTENLKSNVNSELNKICLTSTEDKKNDKLEKTKKHLSDSSTVILGNDKNVQNNLNLLVPEKTSNKDISNLMELNVNIEESPYSKSEPCCSSANQNVKGKTINKIKDVKSDPDKEVNVYSENKILKRNHDKKSLKKRNSRDESKSEKRNSEKVAKKEKNDTKSFKKYVSEEKVTSKDINVSSENKKNSLKKENSKSKIENKIHLDEVKKNKSNDKKSVNKTEKTSQIENYDRKSIEKSHKDKRESSKDVKPNNENNSAFQKKDCLEKANDDVFAAKNHNNAILTVDSEKKVIYDIQQPSCSTEKSRKIVNSSSSSATNKETDDDSDYDLTLDQFIKLQALKVSDKSNTAATNSKLDSNLKNVVCESKDGKVANKDFDKKTKKDGESSKHKKDKDGSKSKSHDKDQKTPKKEDKLNKKDPKSLAKLHKKEREKEKSKSRKDEKSKHKKDSSSSSKSKKDSDKDASKSSKKDIDDSSVLSILGDSNADHSESKKDKTKKELKLSRSSSCDETKSPKKKKKHNEFKDIEKIKNLISKSSILSEFSGFKEFKRRSSSDKSEQKKSKKKKKMALLKDKKLSKKLSSKLLRKYSKKKGLKSKKKLLKKELKEMKIAELESKILAKSKKQKHKMKGDHHGKDCGDKIKNNESSVSVIASKTINITSTPETTQLTAKVTESLTASHGSTSCNVVVNSQTCTSSTSTVPTYIIESIPDVIPPIETISSQPIAGSTEQYVFSSADELQGIVTSDFTGVFEETFPTGAILLATRDTISQVPLHFIQDIPAPKTMADAATNTGEDDLEETIEVPETLRNDEMSVGTQTMTPVGSPSPTVELQPLILPQGLEPCLKVNEKNEISKSFNPTSSPVITPEVSVIKTIPTITPVKTTPAVTVVKTMHTVIPIKNTPSVTLSKTPHSAIPVPTSHTVIPVKNTHTATPVKNIPTVTPVKNTPTVNPVKNTPTVTPLKNIPSVTPLKSTPTVTPLKSTPTVTPVKNTPTVTPVKNTPTVTPVKTVLTPSLAKTTPASTPVKTIPAQTPAKSTSPMSSVNITPSVTLVRTSPAAPLKTASVETPVKTTPVKNPIKAVTVGSPAKAATVVSPVKTISAITPSKTASIITPTKSFSSNKTNDTASTSPKPKRRSSFIKKSKTQSILLPEGQPFPLDSAKMVSAPVYYPSIDEFRDPLEYIFKIQDEAAQFGICKIVPPSSFKPECKVNDDMRFTAHNQYLHKMLKRWGPNVQHTACIKKHLKSQKVKLEQAPLIGGIELDISRFYHTVQQYGGLQQVIEKKKWQRVADTLRVPKTAQDRVTKLYDAYCKYLVSYDTLPKEEKEKLEKEVISDHERRVKYRNSPKDQDKEEEDFDDEENTDCVSKGRSMSLSNFFRIARNIMNMWFKNAPSSEEVEHEYWKVVTERLQHVVVHAGNIDSSVYQSGFACNRNSPFAKHPWNLKILTNNSNSILRCMGPVSGVTIPTLHVGMLFTTGCWYRDPHSLPWIEYLHTGASKIWYSIPSKGCEKFRESMKKIMPEYCTNNPIWLPSDTAMVPPELLVQHGASLSRTIQNSGQFIVIFPESFTSTICCGYCVSESVYFAPTSWLDLAVRAFKDIQSSCEPPSFSLERLLLSIASDLKSPIETLQKILLLIQNIRLKDTHLRAQLSEVGLKQWERLPVPDIKDKKKKSKIDEEYELECEVCRTHCYLSMVVTVLDETVYCLPHALEHIPKKNLKLCKLKYRYDEKDLKVLEASVSEHITMNLAKLSKKKSPKKKVTPAPEK